jgi:hypothetical protein
MVITSSKINSFFKIYNGDVGICIGMGSQYVLFDLLYLVKFFYGLWSLWSLCRCGFYNSRRVGLQS